MWHWATGTVRFTAEYDRYPSLAWLSADGALTGFFAVDRQRDLSQARRLIAAGHVPDPARLADPAVPLRAT